MREIQRVSFNFAKNQIDIRLITIDSKAFHSKRLICQLLYHPFSKNYFFCQSHAVCHFKLFAKSLISMLQNKIIKITHYYASILFDQQILSSHFLYLIFLKKKSVEQSLYHLHKHSNQLSNCVDLTLKEKTKKKFINFSTVQVRFFVFICFSILCVSINSNIFFIK